MSLCASLSNVVLNVSTLVLSIPTCRELFVDGYSSAGQRIYDKVEGMTCHQCRQKTVCKHTSCSSCQLLVVGLLRNFFCHSNKQSNQQQHWLCPTGRLLRRLVGSMLPFACPLMMQVSPQTYLKLTLASMLEPSSRFLQHDSGPAQDRLRVH